MPYFKTAQEWLDQSSLLLEARPFTTRIVTKYAIKPAPIYPEGSDPKPPRGTLVIKTYDPASGTTLKYKTTKAQEVSWLIQMSLGKLGRGMANVPEPPAEESMPDAPTVTESGNGAGERDVSTTPAPAQGPSTTGGGGGKKKKKGKK